MLARNSETLVLRRHGTVGPAGTDTTIEKHKPTSTRAGWML